MSYRIRVTREGSLLPVVLDVIVDDEMAARVEELLDHGPFDFSDAPSWGAKQSDYIDLDSPLGAGESVEAFRG